MLDMLIAVALAEAQAAEPQPRAVPERQAQATVRIMRAEAIRLGEQPRADGGSLLRETKVRESDGSTRPASLIEFY